MDNFCPCLNIFDYFSFILERDIEKQTIFNRVLLHITKKVRGRSNSVTLYNDMVRFMYGNTLIQERLILLVFSKDDFSSFYRIQI